MTQKDKERIEAAAKFAACLCMYAGENQEFYDGFWQRLLHSPEILREFIYYMEHQEFCCKVKAAGRTVADIMVWQIDHFKANLDRGQEDMRCNKDKMILYAFDTMTRMLETPEPYAARMSAETGTDFQGKYGM